MFRIALILGIYGYLIFLLGIFGLLYKNTIITISSLYILIVFFLTIKSTSITIISGKYNLSRLSKFILLLIIGQTLVNLIGALGPELSFDALWYHLTIPKIFLDNHKIFHIPGNLLYYSDLPKNIDLIYLSLLTFSNEIVVKLAHFGFGLLSMVALYKLSKKFLNQEMSFLTCLVFYSNLVVGWQSTTSYIDLGIAFFEIVTLYQFILWLEERNIKHLLYSSVSLGLALSSKISAFNSVLVFLALATISHFAKKLDFSRFIKSFSTYFIIPVLITLPWFAFSYINTGNPFYPLFETNFTLSYDRNPISVLNLFLFASDPINPVYLISIPLIILLYKRFDYKVKILVWYAAVSLTLWFITSSIGGSRFILPYLPAYSVLVVAAINKIKFNNLRNYLILIIILVALSTLGYRFLANYKYIPVLLGTESKKEFLSKNLNFSFGDFYDVDGYFKENIKPGDRVLLYGFHNLYYVDFPYVDSSWVKEGDKFNYIAVQNAQIPNRFSEWKQIYYNEKTKVKLYSRGGKKWEF